MNKSWCIAVALLCASGLPGFAGTSNTGDRALKPVADVAREFPGGGSLALTFRRPDCEIAAEEYGFPRTKVEIPLRRVRWKLSLKESQQGARVFVATARCQKKSCVSGSFEAHTTGIPHRSFEEKIIADSYRLLLSTRSKKRARRLVKRLNAFPKRHCSKDS